MNVLLSSGSSPTSVSVCLILLSSILDEPINALDDSGTEQVRQILMKHKQRGALIIIACHDADELEFLSDEIIEIAEGRIQPKKDKKSNKQ